MCCAMMSRWVADELAGVPEVSEGLDLAHWRAPGLMHYPDQISVRRAHAQLDAPLKLGRPVPVGQGMAPLNLTQRPMPQATGAGARIFLGSGYG